MNELIAQQTLPPAAPRSSRRRLRRAGMLVGVSMLILAVGGYVASTIFGSNEVEHTTGTVTDDGIFFVIPPGAQAYVPAGMRSAVNMPTVITFPSGENARITITNNDSVRHLAGPFFVDPGQTLVMTFPTAGTYPIECSVDPRESITVVVEG